MRGFIWILVFVLMSGIVILTLIILSIILPDGDKQAGIFAHAFRIIDFMSNYALLFPILLLPIFSKILFQQGKIGSLLKLSTLLLIIPSISAIVPVIVYRYKIFDILYTEHVLVSADVFAILTISYIGMCVSFTFGDLLTANGNLKQLNIMAAFAVLLNLSLNFILIPKYQVMGAAIANASTQVFTIIIHIVLVWKIFYLKFKLSILVRLIGFIVFILVGAYYIKLLQMNWLFGFGILFSSGILFSISIGLLSIKSIKAIFQEKI